MNRTNKITTALGTFGVLPPSRSRPQSSDESDVLAIANEYRLALCDLHQERHNELINLRDRLFPGLFRAMVLSESLSARIYDLEKEIKAHHSDVRDRNAVTADQKTTLEILRKERTKAKVSIAEEKAPWLALFKGFRAWWKSVSPDPERGWQDVKMLDKRKVLYAALVLPDGPVGEYARLWIDLDLRERELDREFAPRLHPTIRAEIKEASQPKLGKSAPGIRYRFGKMPDVRPWEKLSIKFVGGLSVQDAIAGKSRQLRMEPLYTNHCAGGDETTYRVSQQIGTAANPRWAEYLFKMDFLWPVDAVIQRWSLLTRGDKRRVIPIFANIEPKLRKGSGVATYKLRWSVRQEGVEVAHIWGDHVNERVIVPTWIVQRVLAVAEEQAISDRRCNQLLQSRGATPEAGKKQGMEALADYLHEYPLDNSAANLLHDCSKAMHLIRKDAESARRAIEDIYSVVANRVCNLHSQIVHDDIDLAKIKRYDTRNLLQEDVLPAKSREILQAVSPGKLRERMKRAKLPASGDVPQQPPPAARETDHWTSYVRLLGQKTGTKPNARRHRSQNDPGIIIVQ